MKHSFFFCFLFLVFTSVKAQTDPLTQSHGARSQSLGNLRVNLSDSWAYFNNIGSLDRIAESELAVGVDHRFGLNELSTFNLVGAWKNNFGTIGFGVSRFGGSLFNQQTLGLGFSNQFGIISMGMKAEWLQTQVEGFGTGNALILSLGGVAELSPQFFLGAHISNINRGKISQNTDDRLPTSIQMGITYRPVSQVNFYVEAEKDVEINPTVKVGLEYAIREWLWLRAGANTNPGRVFFGIGLKPGRFQFDYGFSQNSALGSTNHVSLGIRWAKD